MKQIKLLKQKKQIILQGAPGTGKTYKTAELAVALCDNVDTASMNREDIMERYRELCMEGRIGFTTFHQSMDYEEFVEGIKPIINLDKQTEYIINKGIFKSISQKALLENIKLTPNSYTELEFEDNYDLLISAIKTGGITEFQQKSTSTPIEVINISKNRNIIFRHKGCNKQYIISKERLTKLYDHYKTSEAFYRIKNINNEFRDIIGGCNCSGYWAILNYLFSHNSSVQPIDIDIKNLKEEEQENLIQRFISDMKKDRVERTNKQAKPYLLIIDEINRGNISKIFGELITLLEADKRIGEENELTVTLPYSQETFGVPNNLYIIGTMNTADRSVGYIDYAIRRRFAFITLKADRNVIENYYTDNDLKQKALAYFDQVDALMKVSSEYEKDDLMIGHSYFLAKDEEELQNKMVYEVRPLLLEYFNDGLLAFRKDDEEYKVIKSFGEA